MDPIASWVHKADGLTHSAGGASLRAHAFAAPEKVKELMGGVQSAVAAFNETNLAKMQLYLPNPQTRGVLLTPIRSTIVESYARSALHPTPSIPSHALNMTPCTRYPVRALNPRPGEQLGAIWRLAVLVPGVLLA